MDKLDFSGIEVSAEELVVALQREGKRRDLKTFPNTAAGHQAVIRHLSCPGRTVRVTNHRDRKSTRLNSSHITISYAVFCLKKKKIRAQRGLDIQVIWRNLRRRTTLRSATGSQR